MVSLLMAYISVLLLLQFGPQVLYGDESQNCGPKGEKGDRGVQGPPGNAGPSGPQGSKGNTGLSGGDVMSKPNANAAMISTGPKGEKGDPGIPGIPGPTGRPGFPGIDGRPGSKGDPGVPGIPGPIGRPGIPGLPGSKGQPGSSGGDVTSLQSQMHDLTAKIAMIEKVASFDAFRKVGEKYFVYDGFLESIDKGIKYCKEIGGAIALPRNVNENKALVKVSVASGLDDPNRYPYIAATDRDKEGQFVDINGKPLTFTNWDSDQPDDYMGVQDCSVLRVGSGFWDDIECDKRPIICEIEIK
ncbi:uncharacterized protein [Misgurnus anguillicaudatus]|uniref:uncharacterized protein n=1 Tax=Misgurnus anguillicaudatus TaxID=75329 RepID=UPI003CCF1BB6